MRLTASKPSQPVLLALGLAPELEPVQEPGLALEPEQHSRPSTAHQAPLPEPMPISLFCPFLNLRHLELNLY